MERCFDPRSKFKVDSAIMIISDSTWLTLRGYQNVFFYIIYTQKFNLKSVSVENIILNNRYLISSRIFSSGRN